MVKEYDNFISDIICDRLIKISYKNLSEAEVLGEKIDGYRTANSCWLYDDDYDIVKNYRQKISELVNLPIENMESLHIVSYDVGGEYKEHHDFFHPTEEYFENTISAGGQRTKTCLLYLNDSFEGGETEFINLGIKIKPKIGKLIVWDNLNEDGSLDYDSLHAGLPVIEGKKFIAVIWIRENKFI